MFITIYLGETRKQGGQSRNTRNDRWEGEWWGGYITVVTHRVSFIISKVSQVFDTEDPSKPVLAPASLSATTIIIIHFFRSYLPFIRDIVRGAFPCVK
jgi:hypothetical protein